MPDYGKSGRRDTYTYYLVDPFTLNETGETVEVEEGSSSLTWDYTGENILSGSFTLLSQPPSNRLIRVKHTVEVDGTQQTQTLGTLFLDWSGESAQSGIVSRNVNAYSTYWRFTQDCIVQDFFRPIGYNVVQELREIIEVDGGKLLVRPGVDVNKTHTMDICFPIETNRAEVINTIAGWINCEVTVDGNGYVVLQPYVDPRLKTPKYDFIDNQNCTYVPGVDIEDDKSQMVNRVVYYYSTKDATDRVMVDLPDSHPYSYVNIGRRVTHFEKIKDPASQHDMLNAANILLGQLSSNTKYYEIEHAYIPNLTVGDVVTYQNNYDYTTPISATCQIVQMDMTLGDGGMCRTKLKEV